MGAPYVGAVIGSALAILILVPFANKAAVWLARKLRAVRHRAADREVDSHATTYATSGMRVSKPVPSSVPDPHVIVYGAGLLGKDFKRRTDEESFFVFGESNTAPITIVAYIDDDHNKHGGDVSGIPIRGSLEDLPDILKAHKQSGKVRIEALVIAIAGLQEERISRAIDICKQFEIKCHRFGFGLGELASG